MTRVALLALVALLAACGAPDRDEAPAQVVVDRAPETPPATPPPVEPGVAVPDAAAIVGEWRVAAIDGRDIDQPHAITASIGPDRMRFVSQCITLQWRYTLRNGVFATDRIANEVPNCARLLSPAEARLKRAIDASTRAARLPSNALLLSGPDGSVTLFTQ